MIDSLFSWDKIRTRLRTGPAAPYLDDLATTLTQQQYRSTTICSYVNAADAFGRWLKGRGLCFADIDDALVDAYLTKLGRRKCLGRTSGCMPTAAYGVRRLVERLREQGVIVAHSAGTASAGDEWLVPYAIHLERLGLSSGTRRMYMRFAGSLLDQSFGGALLDGKALTAENVTAFVRDQASRLKPSSCRAPVTATRTFLRYLTMKDLVPATMVSAVPTIRQWKLAELPKYVTEDEVARVLASCEATPLGRRDRAILRLLVRLGLRAGEVVQLQLDDIDWREGCIRIRAGKSARERVLPLQEDVAVDLIAYLRDGRPKSNDRAVFLRSCPPYRRLKNSACVSSIATTHIKRAGIVRSHNGAHMFRHTAATQMVSHGATFKQVADILGHRRLETTAIYAKLDLEKLSCVAMPLPGGVR